MGEREGRIQGRSLVAHTPFPPQQILYGADTMAIGDDMVSDEGRRWCQTSGERTEHRGNQEKRALRSKTRERKDDLLSHCRRRGCRRMLVSPSQTVMNVKCPTVHHI